jgi:hypothetical protein
VIDWTHVGAFCLGGLCFSPVALLAFSLMWASKVKSPEVENA